MVLKYKYCIDYVWLLATLVSSVPSEPLCARTRKNGILFPVSISMVIYGGLVVTFLLITFVFHVEVFLFTQKDASFRFLETTNKFENQVWYESYYSFLLFHD